MSQCVIDEMDATKHMDEPNIFNKQKCKKTKKHETMVNLLVISLITLILKLH